MSCKGSTLFEVGVKPLAYNPTGYPYSGCTPAEPASVYPLRYTGGILNALKTHPPPCITIGGGNYI